jgi:hypothetical protein
MFPYIIIGGILWLAVKRAMNKGNADKYKHRRRRKADDPLKNKIKPILVPITEQAEIPKTRNRTEEGNPQPTPSYQPNNRWMVLLTSLIFFVTAVQAVVSYYQWRTMKDSLEMTQRAYVVITNIKADFPARQIQMTLENTGHVPAKDVRLELRIERLGDYKIYPVETYSTGEEVMTPAYKTIAYLPLKNLTQESIDLITSGNYILQIGTFLRYEDGFGNVEDLIFNFRYIPPPNEGWESLYFWREGDEEQQNSNRRWELVTPTPSHTPSENLNGP